MGSRAGKSHYDSVLDFVRFIHPVSGMELGTGEPLAETSASEDLTVPLPGGHIPELRVVQGASRRHLREPCLSPVR